MKNKLVLLVLFCLLCTKGFATITGTLNVCVGSTRTLSDATHPGGTWASLNTAAGTISSGGVFTAIGADTCTISYTYSGGGGGVHTVVMTVNAVPVITGDLHVCAPNSTTSLSGDISGGTWNTTTPGKISIHSTSGLVTGIQVGTQVVTYTKDGCKAFATVTSNPNPTSHVPSSEGLPGDANSLVCLGNTIAFNTVDCIYSGLCSPGIYSSSATSIATVNPTTGATTGISTGIAHITYTYTTGCYLEHTVQVFPLPNPISGPDNVCVGSNITLSSSSTPAIWWASSAVGTASVVPGYNSTASIKGVATGTAVITYRANMGAKSCNTTKEITVGSIITGNGNICVGATTTLSATPPGGSWSSTNTGVATVGSSTGIVTGVSTGTSTISYNGGTGCVAAVVVTVNAIPVITGTLTVCAGATTTLNGTPSGGAWSSGNTDIATVGSASGIVTGVAGGTVTISYTTAAGCMTTETCTVEAPVITGTLTVCLGSVTALEGSPSGGTWSSSNGSVATVGTTGIVTGISAGTATISYILATGCYTTATVTVGSTTKPSIQCIQDEGTGELGFNNVGNIASITVNFTAKITDGTTVNPAVATTPKVLATGSFYEFTQVTMSDVIGYSGWTLIGFDLVSLSYSGCTWLPTTECRAGARPGKNNSNNDKLKTLKSGSLSIIPNPNNGAFDLSGTFSTSAQTARIDIMDVIGNVVYTGSIALKDNSINQSISLNEKLANGIYFVKVSNQDTRQVAILTLQR